MLSALHYCKTSLHLFCWTNVEELQQPRLHRDRAPWLSDASSNTVATHEEHFVWVCLRWAIPPKLSTYPAQILDELCCWERQMGTIKSPRLPSNFKQVTLSTIGGQQSQTLAAAVDTSFSFDLLKRWMGLWNVENRGGKKKRKKRTQDSQNVTKTHRNKDDKRWRAAYEMKVSLWERKIKELWQQPNWYYIKHGHLGSLCIKELPQCLGAGGLKIQFEKCKLMPFYRSRLSRILP